MKDEIKTTPIFEAQTNKGTRIPQVNNPNDIIVDSSWETKPKSGLKGLIDHWQQDLMSGFMVFLIALPLCIGISIASGMPPIAGIISAIVGGIVISIFGGANLTINGPAAGLIVVMLGAVQTLGDGDMLLGYQLTLAASVIAGFLIFLFGMLKAGVLGDFFPASVIHGMLAAIGIIVVSKQIHILLGVFPEGKEPIHLIAEIPKSFANINLPVAFIGIISLIILIFFNAIKNTKIKKIPAPLVVVIVAIILGTALDLLHPHKLFLLGNYYQVDDKFLVKEMNLFNFTFPKWDLDHFMTGKFVIAVISIALVQSIETMLSAIAVDKLDPWRRHTDLNKDLKAVGLASMISGMLGGLPMIAEIARSSANVSNGAKTNWSNFFHGLFMLLFVALMPWLIHLIPLAALSALLIMVGYRLANPIEFIHAWQIGKEQFLIFVGTMLVTLFTDLLIGVAVGIILNIIVDLAEGASFGTLFSPAIVVKHENEIHTISLKKSATFTNYLGFKKIYNKIPKAQMIILDLSEASLIDHTVMEHLFELKSEYEVEGGKMNIVGLESMVAVSNHANSSRIRK